MLAVSHRSGLVETEHAGAFAAVDIDGGLVARAGDIDRPYFLRSSAKPFQGLMAEESGADLEPIQLAVACSSHDGLPAHIAHVDEMLRQVGLDQDALRCPPAWPSSESAKAMLILDGHSKPRRIWHVCSGKHAAWLRACVNQGWPTDSYLAPDHPIQARVRRLVTELGGYPVDPVGVDGCGAPVLRTTVRAMATMFSRLASDSRLAPVWHAMHRSPAMVSGVGNADAEIATVFDAVAKRGALGCIGVAVRDQFGMAVKAWDGSNQVAAMAAVDGLIQIGRPSNAMKDALSAVLNPPVLGGDNVVGRYESHLMLEES